MGDWEEELLKDGGESSAGYMPWRLSSGFRWLVMYAGLSASEVSTVQDAGLTFALGG